MHLLINYNTGKVVGDETITAEKLNLWAGEMRQYNESIERRLDKHGLLDPPEDRDETLNDGETKGYENEYYRITVGPDVDDDADDNE